MEAVTWGTLHGRLQKSKNAASSSSEGFVVLHTACLCRVFVMLALMTFVGEVPVCTSGFMPCIPIGLPYPGLTC